MPLVQRCQKIQTFALHAGRQRTFRIQMMHRRAFHAELDTLIERRQISVCPKLLGRRSCSLGSRSTTYAGRL